MKQCQNCGTKLKKEDVYCPECGDKIKLTKFVKKSVKIKKAWTISLIFLIILLFIIFIIPFQFEVDQVSPVLKEISIIDTTYDSSSQQNKNCLSKTPNYLIEYSPGFSNEYNNMNLVVKNLDNTSITLALALEFFDEAQFPYELFKNNNSLLPARDTVSHTINLKPYELIQVNFLSSIPSSQATTWVKYRVNPVFIMACNTTRFENIISFELNKTKIKLTPFKRIFYKTDLSNTLAIVNNVVISKDFFIKSLEIYGLDPSLENISKNQFNFNVIVMNFLIDNELLKQDAFKKYISISDEQVQDYILTKKISVQELNLLLNQKNLSRETYYEIIRMNLLKSEYINKSFVVNESEVRDYFYKNQLIFETKDYTDVKLKIENQIKNDKFEEHMVSLRINSNKIINWDLITDKK